jgi:hypothetical protein
MLMSCIGIVYVLLIKGVRCVFKYKMEMDKQLAMEVFLRVASHGCGSLWKPI